jgi:hypothetical protein
VSNLQWVIVTISVAYAVIGALLLLVLVYARLDWSWKALAVVVTSAFYIVSFGGMRGLLGWATTDRLPASFKLLHARIVEPHSLEGDPGAIYLWVEELDDNNVPSGTPRSFKLKYSPPLADRSNKAKDEIMAGNPQEGTASDMEGDDTNRLDARLDQLNGPNRPETGLSNIEIELLRQAQQVEFRPLSGVALPPKN